MTSGLTAPAVAYIESSANIEDTEIEVPIKDLNSISLYESLPKDDNNQLPMMSIQAQQIERENEQENPKVVMYPCLWQSAFQQPLHSCCSTNAPIDHIAILDWDDTLLPSTEIIQKGHGLRFPERFSEDTVFQHCCQELEDAVIPFLTKLLKVAHVYIVTNGQEDWVQLSAQLFMPRVAILLQNIPVLSARSAFEIYYPTNQAHSQQNWKLLAFRFVVSTHMRRHSLPCQFRNCYLNCYQDLAVVNTCIHTHLLSIGDSFFERTAAFQTADTYGCINSKCIKLAEQPTSEHLRHQLQLLTEALPYIVNHNAPLDLQMTITVNSSLDTKSIPQSQSTLVEPNVSTENAIKTNNTMLPPSYEVRKDNNINNNNNNSIFTVKCV